MDRCSWIVVRDSLFVLTAVGRGSLFVKTAQPLTSRATFNEPRHLSIHVPLATMRIPDDQNGPLPIPLRIGPYSTLKKWLISIHCDGPNRSSAMSATERITLDPAICHGKPCIRGLRYPVENLLELLAGGMSIEQILADY